MTPANTSTVPSAAPVRIQGWVRRSANSKNTATVVPASQVNQLLRNISVIMFLFP